MRKKPRFTPGDLRRYEQEGRGTGVYEHFIAWHRVKPSDPSSMGRSHLQKWRKRQHELLSDNELTAFFLATMHPHVVDIREQMPLQRDAARHELNSYKDDPAGQFFPGTKALAAELGMKHPVVRYQGECVDWVMTTDLLLTLALPNGDLSLLAVSVKPEKSVKEKKRSKALLNLEREYWARRNVPWLLITADLYIPLIGKRLRSVSHWALSDGYDPSLLNWLCDQKHDLNGKNLTQILSKLIAECGDMTVAQNTLWRGVWTGQIPFDLNRSWRPSAQFMLLTPEKFWDQNPIVAGRSSWDV